MKKYKRGLLFLLFSAALAGFVVAGCGKDGTDGTDGTSYIPPTLSAVLGWIFPIDMWDTVNYSGHVDPYNPARGAVNDSGKAAIVWLHADNDLNKNNIYVAHNFSGEWTKPHLNEHLNADDVTINNSYDATRDYKATHPSVGIDNSGNVVAVWLQDYDSTYDRVYRAEYRDGSWDAPQMVSLANAAAAAPTLAVDVSGKAVIAWAQQQDSTTDQIFIRDYGVTSAGAWSDATSVSPVNTDAKDSHATAGDGEFLVTWLQSDGVKDQVFSSDYGITTGDEWTRPDNTADNHSPDGQNSYSVQGAVDNGMAVIVWKQSDGSKQQVYRSFYDPDSSSDWKDPTSDEDNISLDGQHAEAPQVAFNGGKAVIVWRQSDGYDGGDKYKQIFRSDYGITATNAWTDPTNDDLNAYISFPASSADAVNGEINYTAAIDGSGNVVIAWTQEIPADSNEVKHLYKIEHRGGAWIEPDGLSDYFTVAGCKDTEPMVDISVSDNGNMIMTWSENTFGIYDNGAVYNVYKALYKP